MTLFCIETSTKMLKWGGRATNNFIHLGLTSRYADVKRWAGSCDIYLPFKRHIAQEHVVEENTQGPHSGRNAMVAMLQDPLWRAVYVGACIHKHTGSDECSHLYSSALPLNRHNIHPLEPTCSHF